MKTRNFIILTLLFALFLSIQATSAANVTINPEDSIQDAINNAGSGDTIIMNTGTYNQSGIQINKELTITGATNNPDDVIIDAQNNSGIIEVLASVNNVKIQGLTITNGYNGTFPGSGAGISNMGGTTAEPTYINNCKFTNNYAWEGGAIYNYGNLIITDCTLTNNSADGNGGGISNRGDMTIINSTFQKNYAPSFGGGLYNLGDLNITNCIFQHNNATGGGGLLNDGELTMFNCIIQQNFADNGGGIGNFRTMTITGSTIQQNTAEYGGGIINFGDMTAHFNRIISNTPNTVYNFEGTFNAENNWWGSNINPTSINNTIIVYNGLVDADPWLIMEFTANPTTITQGQTSKLTASFNRNSDGILVGDANNHIPDGTSVIFTTNLGNVGSKSVTVGTINGIATAILRGDEAAGEAVLSAILDNQTLTYGVTITPTVNAASEKKTIGMQETGLPISLMVLAILTLLGGFLVPKRK